MLKEKAKIEFENILSTEVVHSRSTSATLNTEAAYPRHPAKNERNTYFHASFSITSRKRIIKTIKIEEMLAARGK